MYFIDIPGQLFVPYAVCSAGCVLIRYLKLVPLKSFTKDNQIVLLEIPEIYDRSKYKTKSTQEKVWRKGTN